MIRIVAKNYIKEEDIDDFIAYAQKLVQATVRLDEGCIQYELCKDVDDPTVMVMIEAWEDQASLDEHMRSEHFQTIVPILHKFSSKPGEMDMYHKIV